MINNRMIDRLDALVNAVNNSELNLTVIYSNSIFPAYGMYDAYERRIYLLPGRDEKETAITVVHELVHALQWDNQPGYPLGLPIPRGMRKRWFEEYGGPGSSYDLSNGRLVAREVESFVAQELPLRLTVPLFIQWLRGNISDIEIRKKLIKYFYTKDWIDQHWCS